MQPTVLEKRLSKSRGDIMGRSSFAQYGPTSRLSVIGGYRKARSDEPRIETPAHHPRGVRRTSQGRKQSQAKCPYSRHFAIHFLCKVRHDDLTCPSQRHTHQHSIEEASLCL